MSNRTVVIAFLDKSWPPQHSFVDGMLAGELAREVDICVRLVVPRLEETNSRPRRYLDAVCLPILFPRRGAGRFLNLWSALKGGGYQAIRERRRGNRVVLFVRNDPVFLLAAALLRGKVDRLIFQSSFPHEKYSSRGSMRWVAKRIYRVAGRSVDGVTGVSPEGMRRAQRLCSGTTTGVHIPLLADLPVISKARSSRIAFGGDPVFIYIGSHAPEREMEVVLRGIVSAVDKGVRAKFRLLGASFEDEVRLKNVVGVDSLIGNGVLQFERAVTRDALPEILSECDVGISLIPPKPVYYESSPTKLAEYMGAGLAVLASTGIPMQERFMKASGAGILIDWNTTSIAEGIQLLCDDPERLKQYGENAAKFALSSLRYRSYLPRFRQLLDG